MAQARGSSYNVTTILNQNMLHWMVMLTTHCLEEVSLLCHLHCCYGLGVLLITKGKLRYLVTTHELLFAEVATSKYLSLRPGRLQRWGESREGESGSSPWRSSSLRSSAYGPRLIHTDWGSASASSRRSRAHSPCAKCRGTSSSTRRHRPENGAAVYILVVRSWLW